MTLSICASTPRGGSIRRGLSITGNGARVVLYMVLGMTLLLVSSPVAEASVTQRASVRSNGTQFTAGDSHSASMSADGRFVAFVAPVVDPANPAETINQVFVRDRVAGTTELVSVAPNATTIGNRGSGSPSISSNGSVVAFVSLATNLISAGTNGQWHVFVRDRVTGTTELVTKGPDGSDGNFSSFSPSLSGNGLVVAFMSFATNLVTGIPFSDPQVYVHDRVRAKTELVSAAPGSETTPGDDRSFGPSLNEDGHYVAFVTRATNLLGPPLDRGWIVVVRDRVRRTTRLVGDAYDGPEVTAPSDAPSISADGRFVAFSRRTVHVIDLVTPTFAFESAIFLRDRVTGQIAGLQGYARAPAMSGDGRYVAFVSSLTNLAANDTNGVGDVFLRDLVSGATERISVASSGAQGLGPSDAPVVSGDGRYVTFSSDAPGLVAGDTNGVGDVFVRDRQTSQSPQLSINDVERGEGASGTSRTFVFTVTLSPASSTKVTVNYWVDSGPASSLGGGPTGTAPATVTSEFASASGTLTFSPGQTSKTITVTAFGDNAFERSETFVVNLDVPTGAVIRRSPGIGTILNDDAQATAPVGTFDLTPAVATVSVHERITYVLTWAVPPPLNWHDLQSVQLRFSDEDGIVLWVGFDEADGTFGLLNGAGHRVGRAYGPGHHGPLQSNTATVHLRDSRVQGSGPTGVSVTLSLDVRFKPHAAGRTYLVEVLATNDEGVQQIEPAGTLTVTK